MGAASILRSTLKRAVENSRFTGETWNQCVEDVLQYPGIGLWVLNSWNKAPASRFLALHTEPRPARPGTTDLREPNAFHDELMQLGETVIQQVLALNLTPDSPGRRCTWTMYLNETLDEVLTWNGIGLPDSPSFTDIKLDLTEGRVVRQLVSDLNQVRVAKIDMSSLTAYRIELASAANQHFEIRFSGLRSVQHPENEDDLIRSVEEVVGPRGFHWFVFQPLKDHGQRKLAVQADSAEWRDIT